MNWNTDKMPLLKTRFWKGGFLALSTPVHSSNYTRERTDAVETSQKPTSLRRTIWSVLGLDIRQYCLSCGDFKALSTTIIGINCAVLTPRAQNNIIGDIEDRDDQQVEFPHDRNLPCWRWWLFWTGNILDIDQLSPPCLTDLRKLTDHSSSLSVINLWSQKLSALETFK